MIALPALMSAPSCPDAGASASPVLTDEQLLAQTAATPGTDASFLTMLLELTAAGQEPGGVVPSFAKKAEDHDLATLVPPGALIDGVPQTSVPIPSASSAATLPVGADSASLPGIGLSALAFSADAINVDTLVPKPTALGSSTFAANAGVQTNQVQGSAAVVANAQEQMPDVGESFTPNTGSQFDANNGAPSTLSEPAIDPGAQPIQVPRDAANPAQAAAPTVAPVLSAGVQATLIAHAANQPADDDAADSATTPQSSYGSGSATAARAPHEVSAHIAAAQPAGSLTDQVRERAQAHLAQLREAGHVEIQMQLHPPELGRVHLHLALDDGQLNVHFVVQNDAAKSALDQQWEPLRVRFAELGLSLGQFDVRQEGRSSDWQAAEESARAGAASTANKSIAVPRSTYAPPGPPSTLIDVIA